MQVNIRGNLYNPDGTSLKDAIVSMRLNKTGFTHKEIRTNNVTVKSVTDTNGFYDLTVTSTDIFVVDAKYILEIVLYGKSLYRNLVYVPSDRPIISLKDVIPYESLNGKSFDLFPVVRTVKTLPRLSAKYWTCDGQASTISSIVTKDTNSFRVETLLRKKNDFVGVLWFSKDTLDHKFLSYIENNDYSDLVWSFDLALSDSFAPIEDESKGLTLTVKSSNPNGTTSDSYIHLSKYATGTGRNVHVSIDFNSLMSGFNADELVDPKNITQIFFGLVGDQYTQTDNSYLSTEFYGWMEINNMVVTGRNSSMYVSHIEVPSHELGMSTAYDDHYNQTPERIVENILSLGYRDWINHYCGMSHYWNVLLSPSGVALDKTSPVNRAAAAWHSDFYRRCQAASFKVINSVSYELYSTVCPLEWTQKEWDGTVAATGYIPPSYLVSPSSSAGMAYISDAMVKFSQLAQDQGLEVYVQIGEPWWWLNQNGHPCFYDADTKALYQSQTGHTAPYIAGVGLSEAEKAQPEIAQFMAWLRNRLGDNNQYIRQRVKAAVPGAKVSILFFLPSILDPSVGILNYINYPSEAYSYPNYDFMQTECYDWVTAGLLGPDKAERGYTSALNELGYPANLVQYLAGFAPLSDVDAWKYIFQSVKAGDKYNIEKVHIWAYPNVMRDSITYFNHSSFFYFNQHKIEIFKGGGIITTPQPI